MIDRYGGYVLLETSEPNIEALEQNHNIDELKNRNMLNIKGHEFDTNEGYPDFDSDLMIDEYEPETEGLYIVDMIGPVNPEWREKLESTGVEVINYVPNYAYEVKMTPEIAEEVERFEFVDWVGIYQPEFKLAENLEIGEVNIRLVEGASEDSIKKLESNLDTHSVTELSTGGIKIRADVSDDETFVDIAKMSQVYYISNFTKPRAEDGMGTQITGGGSYFWPPDWKEDDGAFRLEEGSDAGNPEGDYGGEAGSLANQLGYTGDGVTIAVADSGIGDGKEGDAGHPDFTGRVKGGFSYLWGESENWQDTSGLPPDSTIQDSHGTTAAGIAAADTYQGNGSKAYEDYYKVQGAAPEAELFAVRILEPQHGAYEGPDDYYEVVEKAREESDAYIHTNSWGQQETETLGSYMKHDEDFDKAARDAGDGEPMVITASAGNRGELGTSSPGTGKNIISVGATYNLNPGSEEKNPDMVWGNSARGWTDDNRIKPDVVAPGQDRISTATPYDDEYPYREDLDGTSFATPNVAGQAAVVVDWYEDTYNEKPSPAMVKALLINTAEPLENDQSEDGNIDYIPNKHEGWGLVNLADIVREDGPNFKLEDQETLIETGDKEEYEISYEDGDEPLKISLVWTDKEAQAGETDTLKNDLNLEVVSPYGDEYRGNAFAEDEEDSFSDDGYTYPDYYVNDPFDSNDNGWDDVNNVQNVYIHEDDLEPGTYTVTVHGEEINLDANNDGENNQDYALVMQNAQEPVAHELSISVSGEGTTIPAPGVHVYDPGSEVTVHAHPDDGWRFEYWTGDIFSTSSITTIIMDEDKSITANFYPDRFLPPPPPIIASATTASLERAEYEEYLEEGSLSCELLEGFRKEGIEDLGKEAELSRVEEGWWITVEGEKEYWVYEKEEELKIYAFEETLKGPG